MSIGGSGTMKFMQKLKMMSKESFGVVNPKRMLAYLMRAKRGNVVEIAKLFSCTPEAVYYWLKKFGLYRPKESFDVAIRRLGYSDARAFFKKNWNLSFKELAKMLGMSYPTVSKYYRRFLNEMISSGEVKDVRL